MFSLDLSTLTDNAASIFNSLSPIVGILGGISLGLGLVVMVLTLVMSLAKRKV